MNNRIALQILEELTKVRKLIEQSPETQQILIDTKKDRVDSKLAPTPSLETASISTPSDTSPPPSESKMPWLDIARRYVDKVDENDPAGFEQIQKWGNAIGFHVSDPSVPWCGVFVGGILTEAGIDGIKSARARDYANQGKKCDAQPGALWVGQSHVAFIDKVAPDGSIEILGGNQSNKCCIQQARFYGQPITTVWPVT